MNNLAKKVGQLLVIGFDGKKVPNEVKSLIHSYHIGGVILFSRNIGTPEQILALTNELQSEAKKAKYKHPLFICIDQENGVVRRIDEGTSTFPGAMALGATDNPDNAYKIGLATGRELKALGINWNLAPVLDVNNNPGNPVIGVRSYGELPERVAQFGQAAMKGMQEAGIATTLKHFPGHGDTNVDSHLNLPVISHNMDRLEKVELIPFKHCINAGADVVMSAHVYFPSIEKQEEVPATLSKKVINGLLREKLGFKGVVTTDCMEMNAISKTIGTEKGGAEAIKAGVDFVMVSHTFARQVGTIKEIIRAIENGEIEEGMIDQSNKRIQTLKNKYLNWDDILLMKDQRVPEIVGSKQHEKMAYDVYKESVTIVKSNGILPLKLRNEHRVLVIETERETTTQVEDRKGSKLSLGAAIQECHPFVEVHQVPNSLSEMEMESIIKSICQFDSVIIGTHRIIPGSQQITLIEKMVEQGIVVIVVAMRSPYDLSYLPNIPVISTYEFTYPSLKIAAGVIFGKEEASGNLPVTIK